MILFLPELALTLMALVFFFASFTKLKGSFLQGMGLALSALAVAASVYAYGQQGNLFFDAYHIDYLSQIFKVILCFGLFIVIYLGDGLSGINKYLRPEYYFFLTLSVFGLVCMSSAVELITIMLCLEISSFALFIIIPFRKQGAFRAQMEAGIKYALFGAAASGVTLYGMSYVFGMTHTTYLVELVKVIPELSKNEKLSKICRRSEKAVYEINKMVSNILSVEKFQLGKFKVNKSSYVVRYCVEEALQIFQPVAPKEQETVHTKLLIPRSLNFVTDKDLFQHILYNLVSNAIRFSREERPVEVEVENLKEILAISVKNSTLILVNATGV